MIAAFDTYYFGHQAKTVAVVFEHWTDAKPLRVYSAVTDEVAEYEPGAFYKRELPCIVQLWAQMDVEAITCVVVDGFVELDGSGRLGLGAHLFRELGGHIPVVGVAKTDFAQPNPHKRAVLRGDSHKPLFVTAVGVAPDWAAEQIRQMHGPFRLPTLLKTLDTLTKEV